MDVFKIDQSLSDNIGSAPSPDKIKAEVSFDAGSEFNLSFFDAPEDTSAQCYSNPGSVGSTSDSSPPPQQTTVLHLSAPASCAQGALILSSPGTSSAAALSQKQEQYYIAADSNSSTNSKTFVPCKVCGDKASGYHYGVTSCEGCKGFFRRSIQKQIEYRCLRDGKCLVIRLNRNRCQYCRFKKCLAVGMSRDSVRYGRVPKRSREQSTEEATHLMISNADQNENDGKQLEIYDLILTISQAHHANCAYTEENTRNLVQKPLMQAPPSRSKDNEASSTAESAEDERCWLWTQFASSITPNVQRIVEFAKRVPGFCDLSQDDQLILIKIGFFEIWLSHIARLTTSTCMVFDDGTVVTKQQLETMYDTDYADSVISFASTFNDLTLNETELGLFSAILLLSAERPGLTDVKAIEQHQDKLIEALKIQIGRNHLNDLQLFSNVLHKLTELRTIGAKHTSHLDWFRKNWSKLTLPPLFAEIFDIPKSDDDLQ